MVKNNDKRWYSTTWFIYLKSLHETFYFFFVLWIKKRNIFYRQFSLAKRRLRNFDSLLMQNQSLICYGKMCFVCTNLMIEVNLFYIWDEFTRYELLVYLMAYVNQCCFWIKRTVNKTPHLHIFFSSIFFFNFSNGGRRKNRFDYYVFRVEQHIFKCQLLQQWINQICFFCSAHHFNCCAFVRWFYCLSDGMLFVHSSSMYYHNLRCCFYALCAFGSAFIFHFFVCSKKNGTAVIGTENIQWFPLI